MQTLVEKYKLERYITKPKIAKDDFVIRRLEQLLGEATLGVESFAKEDLHLRKVQAIYSEINPDFLKVDAEKNIWTTNRTVGSVLTSAKFYLPNLAIYSLDNPVFHFSYQIWLARSQKIEKMGISFNHEIPPIFEKQFRYLLGYTLSSESYIEGSFESRFVGLIPKDVKQDIQNAKETFGNEIYLVAEAKWDAKPFSVDDPLIIGVVKDSCFLISQFNTTPMEEKAIKKILNKK